MYRDVNKGIVLPCAYVLTLTILKEIKYNFQRKGGFWNEIIALYTHLGYVAFVDRDVLTVSEG